MCSLGNCNIFLAAALAWAVCTAWSTIASCEHWHVLTAKETISFVHSHTRYLLGWLHLV